ncbi:MAG: hypothetical protein DMF81_25115 [Acidobacteria bacterium]|nr:MAG: hypothetical protein DMF81_25115 [Acidobacteriota bacterium]
MENWTWNNSSLALMSSAYLVWRYWPRIWLNSLGQYVRRTEAPLSTSAASSARSERSSLTPRTGTRPRRRRRTPSPGRPPAPSGSTSAPSAG